MECETIQVVVRWCTSSDFLWRFIALGLKFVSLLFLRCDFRSKCSICLTFGSFWCIFVFFCLTVFKVSLWCGTCLCVWPELCYCIELIFLYLFNTSFLFKWIFLALLGTETHRSTNQPTIQTKSSSSIICWQQSKTVTLRKMRQFLRFRLSYKAVYNHKPTRTHTHI